MYITGEEIVVEASDFFEHPFYKKDSWTHMKAVIRSERTDGTTITSVKVALFCAEETKDGWRIKPIPEDFVSKNFAGSIEAKNLGLFKLNYDDRHPNPNSGMRRALVSFEKKLDPMNWPKAVELLSEFEKVAVH